MKRGFYVFICLLSVSCVQPVLANGYRANFQGLRQQALGFTGVMHAHDASAAYYNPAAIAFVDDNLNVAFGINLLVGEGSFRNNNPNNAMRSDPTAGPPPYFAASTKLGKHVALGFHFGVPVASAGSFQSNFAGRYNGLGEEFTYMAIQPTIALQLTDWLSIGYGYIKYLEDDEYTSKAYTSIWESIGSPINTWFFDIPAGMRIDLKGTGKVLNASNNFGLYLKLFDGKLRVGGSYRTKADIEETGVMNFSEKPSHYQGTLGALFSNPAAIIFLFPLWVVYQILLPIVGNILNGRLPTVSNFVATGKVIPSEWNVGASYELTSKILLSAQLTRTMWSERKNWILTGDHPEVGTRYYDFSWKDIYSLGLGLEWNPNKKVSFRFGFQYEDNPSNPATSTVQARDHIFYRYTTGAGLHLKNFDVNFYAGWAYGRTTTIRTDFVDSNGNPTLGSGYGRFTYRDLSGGFGLTYKWLNKRRNSRF